MERGSEGFSLVEVVIASSLLAGLLLATSGLFVLGRRQIRSAGCSTRALSAARSILEEMGGWTYRQCYERLGCDGNAGRCARDTGSGALAAWHAALEASLPGSLATVEVESLSAASAPPPLAASTALRVLVTVEWAEGRRRRRLQLGTVRM